MPKGKAASPTRGPRNGGRNGGASLGFEATLWAAAGKLRGHMDAAEYKHVYCFLEGRAAGSVPFRIRLCWRLDADSLICASLPTERVHLPTALSGLPPA